MTAPRRHRRGDPIRADDAADRERDARAAAPSGLDVDRGRAGSEIRMLGDPERFWVVLSGAGPHYAFTRVYGTAGGGWTSPAWAGTGACYESNGLAGLAGKHVEVSLVGGDFRFTWRRLTCPATLCITLRHASDGSPITPTVVTFRDTSAGGAVISTGSTDADGRICSAPFPLDHAYSITIRIATSLPVDGIVAVAAQFVANYPAHRSCHTTHEYDFCEAKYCVTATDVDTGAPISGLTRSLSGGFGGTGHFWFSLPACPTGCTVAPAFCQAYGFYHDLMSGGYGGPDPGAEGAGPGIYCEFYFRLIERPYSCPAPGRAVIHLYPADYWSDDACLAAPCGGVGVLSSSWHMYPVATWLRFYACCCPATCAPDSPRPEMIPKTLYCAVSGPPWVVGGGGTYPLAYVGSFTVGSLTMERWSTGIIDGQGGYGSCELDTSDPDNLSVMNAAWCTPKIGPYCPDPVPHQGFPLFGSDQMPYPNTRITLDVGGPAGIRGEPTHCTPGSETIDCFATVTYENLGAPAMSCPAGYVFVPFWTTCQPTCGCGSGPNPAGLIRMEGGQGTATGYIPLDITSGVLCQFSHPRTYHGADGFTDGNMGAPACSEPLIATVAT